LRRLLDNDCDLCFRRFRFLAPCWLRSSDIGRDVAASVRVSCWVVCWVLVGADGSGFVLGSSHVAAVGCWGDVACFCRFRSSLLSLRSLLMILMTSLSFSVIAC